MTVRNSTSLNVECKTNETFNIYQIFFELIAVIIQLFGYLNFAYH